MDIKIFNCPSCNEKMVISEIRCPKCDLRIKKDFETCEFCQLSTESFEFLKIFLRTQGKITEMEKILSTSYPTIKAKIDSLLKALHLDPFQTTDDTGPIDALARGKLSVDEAVAILKQRRRK